MHLMSMRLLKGQCKKITYFVNFGDIDWRIVAFVTGKYHNDKK